LRPVEGRFGGRCWAVLVCLAVGVAAGACGTTAHVAKRDAAAPIEQAAPPTPVAAVVEPSSEASYPAVPVEADAVAVQSSESAPVWMIAQADKPASPAAPPDDSDDIFDPWEPFNERMFNFNVKLDRYVLKPVARVYKAIMLEPFQVMISNGFDNIRIVPRFVNNLLQGKFGGAGREMSRFLINSTAGIGGLFDPAKDYWGIRPSSEDFGQTLGVWGAGPGPYLVLPVLPPMTVRDGIGMGVDTLIDPLGYFVSWFPARFAMRVGDTVNDRALNYDLFQGVEETTIDLYSSVRHFYLKRREQQIKE
jgi:phospholipid-binding lipoprotein MlaA